ncbi:hypothetical protein SAMN05216262_10416 [Colwellia chukchiensis]|uniref:Uncharacterized protein n=1 Tax=Colwellia chukchiensis TaxID=641665 RepID=A0A1H7L3A6_9GAMM|nr:hypothetical protein [Colwellia chukchiensis]SEK92875.1 hypothetical protein SAMN05216262_10416 [Colwellia chukchiensis]
MRLLITKYVYLISGVLIILLGIFLLSWGYSNSSFPEIENTNKIMGTASDIEVKGWKIDFKISDDLRIYSYYRHYGNYDEVKELLSRNEQPIIEMLVENTDINSTPAIYQVTINGKEVTNFEEKKSNHGEYTNSIYWFAIVLIFIGGIGVFMGLKTKALPEDNE